MVQPGHFFRLSLPKGNTGQYHTQDPLPAEYRITRYSYDHIAHDFLKLCILAIFFASLCFLAKYLCGFAPIQGLFMFVF